MNIPHYLRVLSIAGSDSGGGAGIQADLKTAAALGCYGMSAITALTAQNTLGVLAIHGVPPNILAAQIEAVVEDIGVDAVKIGMLHTPEIVAVLADALARYPFKNVVLDPVMVATSGAKLIEDATILGLVALFPSVSLVTPNLDEAEILLGRKIKHIDEFAAAAEDLLALGCQAVLLKGGHLQGEHVLDVLAIRQENGSSELHRLTSPRIDSFNLHGTGCTLSSAIACYLAQGKSLLDAVIGARSYVMSAIYSGMTAQTGQGAGPLNHGFAPLPMFISE